MTLTELKKALFKGQKVRMIYHAQASETQKERLFKPRYVVKVQTNAVVFNEDKDAKTGSWLEFPKANLIDFDGKTFSVYERGERELTEEEKMVIAGEPTDEKQSEIDALSDGSVMYYRKQNYYRSKGFGYLHGDKHPTLHYDMNHNKIIDNSLRGEKLMTYEIMERCGNYEIH